MNILAKQAGMIMMRSNFIYSLMANIYSAICKFLILLTIIRLGTPLEVGRYNYALVLSAPIFLLASLKIRSIIVTNDEYKVNQFFNAILVTNFIFLIAFMAIVPMFSSSNQTLIIFIVALIKIIENTKEVAYGVYQKEEKLKTQSISMILYFTLSLASFYVAYFVTYDLFIALLLSFICGLLSFMLFDLPVMKKRFKVGLKVAFSVINSKNIVYLALPLSVSAAIGSLNTGLPRIILKEFYDEYTLGIFSAIAYLLVIGSLLASSLSQVFLPRLRKFFREGQWNNFIDLTRKMVLIGSFIGFVSIIISVIFGKTILRIFYGTEYSNQSIVLVVLSLGILFILSGVFLGTAIIATGNYKVNYKIALITLLSITIFSLVFIPFLGLIGTALTITISNFVSLLSYYYFYRKEIKRWINNEENY